MIAVLGGYTTTFGELWDQSLESLLKESIDGVCLQTGVETSSLDAVFSANMLAGMLGNQLHLGSLISQLCNISKPIYRTEAACASGGMAVNLAYTYLQAHKNATVLVVGAEKMTDFAPETVSRALVSAASTEEQEAGLTFPGLYAVLARNYLNVYKYKEEILGHPAVKNHVHAVHNTKAQFRHALSLETINNSAVVADPLRVLHCSPITDGASAIIMTNNPTLMKKNRVSYVVSSAVATDSISIAKRTHIDRLNATVQASHTAFSEAGIEAKDVQVAEVHDCFTIAEILAMEDIGFWKKGTGGKRVSEYETQLGNNGTLIVNPSGGLKAMGHPVGATGVKQIAELHDQLTGQAEERQVNIARWGLAHNVGGSGGTAVVSILSSEKP